MMATTHESSAICWRSSKTTRNVSKGLGMNSSVKATRVHFDPDSMWVDLSDGRILAVPLAWFPRLLHASAEQREQLRISSRGLHWEALDEDISIAGLLAGVGDQTTSQRTVAARSYPLAARIARGTQLLPPHP